MTAKEKYLEKQNSWKNQAAPKKDLSNYYSINIIECVYLSGANELYKTEQEYTNLKRIF